MGKRVFDTCTPIRKQRVGNAMPLAPKKTRTKCPVITAKIVTTRWNKIQKRICLKPSRTKLRIIWAKMFRPPIPSHAKTLNCLHKNRPGFACLPLTALPCKDTFTRMAQRKQHAPLDIQTVFWLSARNDSAYCISRCSVQQNTPSDSQRWRCNNNIIWGHWINQPLELDSNSELRRGLQ